MVITFSEAKESWEDDPLIGGRENPPMWSLIAMNYSDKGDIND